MLILLYKNYSHPVALADKDRITATLSIGKTINLLWNNINSFVIIIYFSHNLLLLFSVVSLIES